MRPSLIAVSGPPGTGKTTLAHALADALGRPAVCRDEIKERMVAVGADAQNLADAHDLNLNLKTNAAFFDTLSELLRSGTSVVAEAAFQDRLWRPGLEPLAELADIRILRCVVDPELARERIAHRAATQSARAAHADAALLRRIADGERPIESWVPIALDVPTLVVDTTASWKPGLAEIVEFASTRP
ncbi:putative kinase [Catenulispora sp. GAS73]|uniref:AAA family ATPase n=1 Tax=Catenulispora sp. GAS73 TaxID=3156269 RepID=UPI003514DF7D